MNDRPGASDLLETARETFAKEILPALPAHLRYKGLMVANAIGIAQRAIAAGDAPLRAEWERVCALFAEPSPVPGGGALETALPHYNRRLVRAIRAGRFDGEGRPALLEHLRRMTEEKLAVSDPRAIPGRGAAGR